MQLQWSLDELYTSIDSEQFKQDFDKLKLEIDKINQWTQENLDSKYNALKKMEMVINMQNEFGHLITKLMEYCELVLSVNSTNEKALQTINKIEDISTELTASNIKFIKWIDSLDDLDKIISSSPILEKHKFYINTLKEKNKHILSETEETIISKMQNTGSSSWTKLQELLTSTLSIDINIDGENKKLPLPAIRNLAYEDNMKIRKSAYEAELNSYTKIDQAVASALNGIKGEVITISKLRKFESPLEMTLKDSRMDKQTLDVMIKAIKQSVPQFHKYFRKKAELLGYNNGLNFYDLFAPIGNSNMSFTYTQATNYIIEKFSIFSKKLSDFVKYAFDHNWIDVEPKEGKRGGAFCSNLHAIKQSRILTNFSGSFSDVITLAHELGHAYHGHCLDNETFLNSDYPMPIAETASTFCETIINKSALKVASDKEALTILENSISDAAQVIVDILSRFIFEDTVFNHRKEGSLSSKELCQIMIDSQKEAYGNGLNHEVLHKYMWICKPHYYSAEYNYYNFPYAFGLLFSKGLYSQYIKKGDEFVSKYDDILAATGKNNLYEIGKMAGVDIHNIDFWKSSLEIIENDINEFLKLNN